MKDDPKSIARKIYQAYVDKDRAAIEALLSEDFHFTSPLDNRLSRATYFDRCWKNSETTTGFRVVNLVSEGEQVLVTYERAKHHRQTVPKYGNNHRPGWQNCRSRSLFRWSIPHEAPEGGFINP